MEGTDHDMFEVIWQNLPGQTEENTEISIRNNRMNCEICVGKDVECNRHHTTESLLRGVGRSRLV